MTSCQHHCNFILQTQHMAVGRGPLNLVPGQLQSQIQLHKWVATDLALSWPSDQVPHNTCFKPAGTPTTDAALDEQGSRALELLWAAGVGGQALVHLYDSACNRGSP